MLNLAKKSINQQIILLKAADNVGIAKVDIDAGTELPKEGIITATTFPMAAFAMALERLKNGQAKGKVLLAT